MWSKLIAERSTSSELTSSDMSKFNEQLIEAFLTKSTREEDDVVYALIVDDVACETLDMIRDEFEEYCIAHVEASMRRHDVSAIDEAGECEKICSRWTIESSEPPPFLVHLFASALIGVSLEEEEEAASQYRERLADEIQGHRGNAGLGSLGTLWSEFEKWTEIRQRIDPMRVSVTLPDPGGWNRVGHARRFLIPSRRDTKRLIHALVEMSDFDASWPVHEVERFIRESGSAMKDLHPSLQRCFDEFFDDVLRGVSRHSLRASRVLRLVSAIDVGERTFDTVRAPMARFGGMWARDAREPLTWFMALEAEEKRWDIWQTTPSGLDLDGFDHLIVSNHSSRHIPERVKTWVASFLASKGTGDHRFRVPNSLIRGLKNGVIVCARSPLRSELHVHDLDLVEEDSIVRLLVSTTNMSDVQRALEKHVSSPLDIVSSSLNGWSEIRLEHAEPLFEAAKTNPLLHQVLRGETELSRHPILFAGGVGAHGTWLNHREALPGVKVSSSIHTLKMHPLHDSSSRARVVCDPVPHSYTSLATWMGDDPKGTWRFHAHDAQGHVSVRDITFVRPLLDVRYRTPTHPAHWWTEALSQAGARLDRIPQALATNQDSNVAFDTHIAHDDAHDPLQRLMERWQFTALRRTGIELRTALDDMTSMFDMDETGAFALLHAWSAQLMLDWCHSSTWHQQRLFLRRPFLFVQKTARRVLLLGWVPRMLTQRVQHSARSLGLNVSHLHSINPLVPGPSRLSMPHDDSSAILERLATMHGLAILHEDESPPSVPNLRKEEFDFGEDLWASARTEFERYEPFKYFDFESWGQADPTKEHHDAHVVRWRAEQSRGGGLDLWTVTKKDESSFSLDESDIALFTHSRNWALVSGWCSKWNEDETPKLHRRWGDGFLAREGTRLPLPRAILWYTMLSSNEVPAPQVGSGRWYLPRSNNNAWLEELSTNLPGVFDLNARDEVSDTDSTQERVTIIRFPNDLNHAFTELAKTVRRHKLSVNSHKSGRWLKKKTRDEYVKDQLLPLWLACHVNVPLGSVNLLKASDICVPAALFQLSLSDFEALMHVDSKKGTTYPQGIEERATLRMARMQYLSIPESFDVHLPDAQWLENLNSLFEHVFSDLPYMGLTKSFAERYLGLLRGEVALEDGLEEVKEEEEAKVLRALHGIGMRDWGVVEEFLDASNRDDRLELHTHRPMISPVWRLLWAMCAWHRRDWEKVWTRLLSHDSSEFVHSTLPLIMARKAWIASGEDPEDLPDIPPIARPGTRQTWLEHIEKLVAQKGSHYPQEPISSDEIAPPSTSLQNEAYQMDDTQDLNTHLETCMVHLDDVREHLNEGIFDGDMIHETIDALSCLSNCVSAIMNELGDEEVSEVQVELDALQKRLNLKRSGLKALIDELLRVGVKEDASTDMSAFEAIRSDGRLLLRELGEVAPELREILETLLDVVRARNRGEQGSSNQLRALVEHYDWSVLDRIEELVFDTAETRRLWFPIQ